MYATRRYIRFVCNVRRTYVYLFDLFAKPNQVERMRAKVIFVCVGWVSRECMGECDMYCYHSLCAAVLQCATMLGPPINHSTRSMRWRDSGCDMLVRSVWHRMRVFNAVLLAYKIRDTSEENISIGERRKCIIRHFEDAIIQWNSKKFNVQIAENAFDWWDLHLSEADRVYWPCKFATNGIQWILTLPCNVYAVQ